MMTKQESFSDWHNVYELLKTGQYEQVAEFLLEAQRTSRQTDSKVLVDILTAAHHICLACSQCRDEAAWLSRTCEAAERREYELKHKLQDILNLVTKGGVSETGQKPVALPANTSLNLPDPNPPEFRNHDSLWRRGQSLFGWRPDLRPIEADAHGLVAQALAVPIVETGEQGQPELKVHCLGPFQVYQDDWLIEYWPSSKGKSIFKYLVTYRKRPVAKEVLMDLFWPDAHPDSARNNLNVAIYGLRQALHDIRPEFSHILFQEDCYLLNSKLQVWVDVEAFREYLSTARSLERRRDLASAVPAYRAAEALYQGEFLVEDRYEDWLLPQRQSLEADYLSLLDRLSRYYLGQKDYEMCVSKCDKMLAVDPCREEAHRRLMRCYARRGQRYLALRQHQLCVETLQNELDVPPVSATTTLFEQIRQGQQV